MKRHATISIKDVLSAMQTCNPETLKRIGIWDIPPAERAAAYEALQRIVATGQVSFQCIGCGESTPATETECCVCGGFVCTACARVEEENVCRHIRNEYE